MSRPQPSRFPRRLRWLRSALSIGALSIATALVAQAPSGEPPDSPPVLPPEVLNAQPPEPPPGPPPSQLPDPTELYAQLRLLHEFLALSPEELERIRRTIELIERMDATERDRMRTRLARIQLELPDATQQLGTFAEWLRAEETPRFRRFWLSLNEATRTTSLASFHALPADQRRAWIEDQLTHYAERERRLRENLSGNPLTPTGE